MDKTSLIIKELNIKEMPGFPRGLEPFRELSPHINIVAGPNASGKSSAARLIQQLIWRKDTSSLSAESRLQLGEEDWVIHLNRGTDIVQSGGLDRELKDIPAYESASRYMLALHDLVKAEERELAGEMAREAVGGYDIDKARDVLDYSDSVRTVNIRQYTAFSAARKRYEDALDDQRMLSEQEARLEDLREEERLAREAGIEAELHELYLEYLEKQNIVREAELHLDSFPAVLEGMTGKEMQQVSELVQRIDTSRGVLLRIDKELKERRDRLGQLDLPVEGVGREVLWKLGEDVDMAGRLDKEIEDLHRELVEAKSQSEEALRAIDKGLESPPWRGLSLDEVSGLDQFLQEAHRIRSRRHLLVEWLNRSKEELAEPAEVRDEESLQEGIRILGYCLQVPGQQPSVTLLKSAVLIALSATLAVLTYVFGLAGLLFLLPLAVAVFYTDKLQANRQMEMRKADYVRTGLESPPAWDVPGITGRMQDLMKDLEEAIRQKELIRNREAWQRELDEMAAPMETIRRQRQEWIDQLAWVPEAVDVEKGDDSSLYWFLQNAHRWHLANVKVNTTEARIGDVRDQLEELLGVIGGVFQAYGREGSVNVSQCRAIYKGLEDDAREQDTIRKEIRSFLGQQSEEQNKLAQEEERLAGIYEALTLEAGDAESLRMLLGQLAGYREAREKHGQAVSSVHFSRERLEAHPRYADRQHDLAGKSVRELEEKKAELLVSAGRRESIRRDITGTETRIDIVKGGTLLEDTLAEKDEALSALYEVFEENRSSFLGDLLAQRLSSETQKAEQLPVLERARALFSSFTRGSHRLILGQGDESGFRAIESRSGLGLKLDELSVGTRVQLLLAVRLAHIEHEESRRQLLKLPILADELFANSDDVRARAIIDSLIEVSKAGRQVFYFTAQSDEVLKWDERLEHCGEGFSRIYALGGMPLEDQRPAEAYGKAFLSLLKEMQVAEPGELSHAAYKEKLGIPSFDLLRDEPGSLHLWYLIDDNDLLYECLRDRIMYWGQLNTFLAHGGQIKAIDRAYAARLHGLTGLLKAFLEMYRKGRPRPIDRRDLERSGAVNETFIDQVSEKLQELNGCPQKLLDALKNGEVRRFLTRNRNALEDYFYAEGVLDGEEPVAEEEIIDRLMAHASQSEISMEDGRRLILRLLNA